jgi:inner membrane protein
MDTVTHVLTGTLVGYCGFRQRAGRAGLWAAVAASVFPDVDGVLAAVSGEAYLRWHRSFTHSFVMLPVWSLLVGWTVWELNGRRDFRVLWAAAAAGMVSHILLDWITSYGTLLLWPLNDVRYALSWVFILDPFVWAMLGVSLWAVLRRGRLRAAPVGLMIVAGYVLWGGIMHQAALSGARRAHPAERVAVYPQPMNPFRWTVVREAGDTIYWDGGAGRRARFQQAADDELIAAAAGTRTAQVYLWFAEFPLVEKLERPGGATLRYRDLRFRTVLPWGEIREGMFVVAVVVFDAQGRVVESRLARGE